MSKQLTTALALLETVGELADALREAHAIDLDELHRALMLVGKGRHLKKAVGILCKLKLAYKEANQLVWTG